MSEIVTMMKKGKLIKASFLAQLCVASACAAFAAPDSYKNIGAPGVVVENSQLDKNTGYIVSAGGDKADKTVVSVDSSGNVAMNGGMSTGDTSRAQFEVTNSAGTSNGKVGITNGKFQENSLERPYASVQGGLVSASGADLTVADSNFKGNSTVGEWGPGGVLYAEGGSKLAVRGSSFESNTSSGTNAPASGTGSAGAAVTARNSEMTVADSTFAGNRAETVGEATDSGKWANSQGGAIYSAGAGQKLSVSNSEFSGNVAEGNGAQGGAVALFNGATSTQNVISGSSFEGNRAVSKNEASSGGGAIYASGEKWAADKAAAKLSVSDSAFSGNSAEGSGAFGGGIAFAGVIDGDAGIARNVNSLSLKNGTFTDNSAVGSGYARGGALYLVGSNYSASGTSLFEGNRAESSEGSAQGGAMYADNAYSTNINAQTFRGNSAEGVSAEGGAAYINNSGHMWFRGDTSFENNSVVASGEGMGGALSVRNDNGGQTVINKDGSGPTSSIFSGNSVTAAVGKGGAVYSENAAMQFTDAVFTGNRVDASEDGKGGAIYAEGKSVSLTYSKDAVISGNRVLVGGQASDKDGGFAYIGDKGGVSVNVKGGAAVTIGDGTAGSDSIASGGNGSFSKSGDGVLTVNSSMEYMAGSAVSASGGTLNINNTLGSKSLSASNSAVVNVDKFVGETVNANGASSINIGEFRWEGQERTAGVAWGGTGSVAIDSFNVVGNDSSARFFQIGNSNLHIKSGEISGNSVAQGGYIQGGLFFLAQGRGAERVFENLDVSDNKVVIDNGAMQGGAIKAYESSATFKNFSATGNYFKTGALLPNYEVEGGVMLVADSDVDIDGAAFEGNSVVKGKGGAIAVTRNVKTGSTLSVKDSKFKGNSADSGGAVAIYHHSQDDKSLASSAVMANVEFSGNSAANQGGAIYIRDNASLEIVADKDVLHSGNTASSGGFMYIGSASNPSSVTFTANGGATVTIGSSDMDKSDKSLDSIASFDEKQSIAKNGAGVLTVNSSMADYKGSLSVTGGSMSVNNTLGSERVSVENGASLSIDALDVDVSSARDRLRIASASGEGSSLKIGSVNVGISSKITAQVPETLAPYSEAVHVVDVADSARVETGDINLNVSGANASVENKITTIFSTGGEAVVNGDINVTVENGASVKAIYACGYNYGNARVNGDINTVVRDSSATSIVAAGGVQGNSGGASGISYGNATVLVENSSVGDIYGAYLYNGEAYKQGASVSASGNSIKISVSGSSAGSIYAGGYAYADSASGFVADSKVSDVSVTLSNAEVAGDVYGGLYAEDGASGTVGNVRLAVSGGSISGDIYAGGYGAGSVVGGDAEVVFSGSSKFAGTVYGGGAGGASVNGQSRVVFGSDGAAYRGVFMGGISGADAVEISAGSSVFFANSFDVEKLSVDSSSTVYLADGTAFGELSIAFGDETFSQGDNFEFDMSGVFTDESVVVSALDSGALLTVLDAAGREWRAAYDGAASVISIGGQIPEPSVYAAILGALSLAAAAVRRCGNPNR